MQEHESSTSINQKILSGVLQSGYTPVVWRERGEGIVAAVVMNDVCIDPFVYIVGEPELNEEAEQSWYSQEHLAREIGVPRLRIYNYVGHSIRETEKEDFNPREWAFQILVSDNFVNDLYKSTPLDNLPTPTVVDQRGFDNLKDPKRDFFLSESRSTQIRSTCIEITNRVNKLLRIAHIDDIDDERNQIKQELERLNAELIELGIVPDMHEEFWSEEGVEVLNTDPVIASEFLARKMFDMLKIEIPKKCDLDIDLSSLETISPLNLPIVNPSQQKALFNTLSLYGLVDYFYSLFDVLPSEK
jgi:hypothetical protein